MDSAFTLPITVNEKSLAKFRALFLALKPTFRRVLLGPVSERIPQGVGKSHKADKILTSSSTYSQFDIVIYIAPTKAIISERLKQKHKFPVKHIVFKPRPRKVCGTLDAQWVQHERLGRTSYAKRTVCAACPRRSRCRWPRTMSDKLAGKQIILCTEQHLINDPGFLLRVIAAAKADRALLILDEAKLANSPFQVEVTKLQLQHFRDVLAGLVLNEVVTHESAPTWIAMIDQLLNSDARQLSTLQWDFSNTLNFSAFDIQSAGVNDFGQSFRYVGFQLTQFMFSQRHERWWTMDGTLKFIARPYLNVSTLILSAHTPVAYLERQLGLKNVQEPYAGLRVLHSKTRIYNLKNLIGAAAYFDRNEKQVLDFYARMIIKNVKAGRSTMLVSRKKFKAKCAAYLTKRLNGWGCPAKFVHEPSGYAKLKTPDPMTIPIIHYGIVGVNGFSEYECCYCLNSYYLSEAHLNQVLQSAEADVHRIRVSIQRDAFGYRKTTVEENYRYSNVALLGDVYLRALEVDPVLQAVGRCRFFTKPREVIFFQTNDLRHDLGEITEFTTLNSAAAFFGLPTVKTVESAPATAKLQALVAQGHSLRTAARLLGVDKSTASRMLKRATALSQKSSTISKKGLLRHPPVKPVRQS